MRRTRGLGGRAVVAVLLALPLVAACDRYDQPNSPLPDLQAVGLDGRQWDREAFAGKPWVINLWVPR